MSRERRNNDLQEKTAIGIGYMDFSYLFTLRIWR